MERNFIWSLTRIHFEDVLPFWDLFTISEEIDYGSYADDNTPFVSEGTPKYVVNSLRKLFCYSIWVANDDSKLWKMSCINEQRSATINPIQDGLFRGCSRMGGAFLAPLPKIRYTYPAIMKLDTVIPYLRKIQKVYKSRYTFLEFCWHQHFFTGNQYILLHQKIHI